MTAASPARRQKLGLVHQLAAQHGLDEDARRAKLETITGHRSAKDCSDAQLDAFIASFHVKRKPNNAYTAKILALWIAAWNLGAVESGDDSALDAFVMRQTGKQRLAFVTAVDAAAVTEALKSILARHGFAVPADDRGGLIGRARLASAQWTLLESRGAIRAPGRDGLNAFAWRIVGGAHRSIDDMAARDLDRVSAALGRMVRKAR